MRLFSKAHFSVWAKKSSSASDFTIQSFPTQHLVSKDTRVVKVVDPLV